MTDVGEAAWIWCPQAKIGDALAEVVLFRRTVELAEGEPYGHLEVTADSRYRLWVNGAQLSLGPAKGSDREWFVDGVDLSPALRTGTNVIAVEVLRYNPRLVGNVSVWRTPLAGLRISGQIGVRGGRAESILSDRTWRTMRDRRRAFSQGRYTYLLGIQETAAGDASLAGWTGSGFDDSSWDHAAPVAATVVDEALNPWNLTARTIPPMLYRPVRFDQLETPVTIPARQTFTIDLDAGELVNGFPRLSMFGGHGAEVTLLAAECYEQEHSHPGVRSKGFRTDAVHGDLYGDADRYSVAGYGVPPLPETYETWWPRTFRYLRVSVTAADEPVVLAEVMYFETGYPLTVRAEFASDEPRAAAMWDVSVRTLRRCVRETFEDCPYYEQLQYAMDARAQALFMLYISGDDRLARKAIRDFALAVRADGLLPSRTPSYSPQVIPGFSLYWILMLHDHYMMVGDREHARRYLGQVDGILGFFERLVRHDGLLGSLEPPYWGFVDWTEQWRESRGVPGPPSDTAGSILSLLYAVALGRAADLAHACGRGDTAAEYRERARACRDAVIELCTDPLTGLVADMPGQGAASEHAQVWAVISGAVTGEGAKTLLRSMQTHVDLAKGSYAMALYLLEALRLSGMAESMDFTPWHEMLDLDLTTWMEDPVSQRSDCHAWGALPLYHYPAMLLGITPREPGFASVRVDPLYRGRTWAKGAIPTPRGAVSVSWRRRGGQVMVDLSAPPGVPIELVTPEGDRVHSLEAPIRWCGSDPWPANA